MTSRTHLTIPQAILPLTIWLIEGDGLRCFQTTSTTTEAGIRLYGFERRISSIFKMDYSYGLRIKHKDQAHWETNDHWVIRINKVMLPKSHKF